MNLKESFFESLRSFSETQNAKTVIGEPVETANGTVIIPVSRLSMGYVSGGVDGASEKKASLPSDKFIGGGGTGISVSPVAFLVVSPSGNVEILNVNQPQSSDPVSSIIGAIERSPELVEKFREVFKK